MISCNMVHDSHIFSSSTGIPGLHPSTNIYNKALVYLVSLYTYKFNLQKEKPKEQLV